MCTLASHVPIVIYYIQKPAYIKQFGWDVNFINAIKFWQNMYHSLIA